MPLNSPGWGERQSNKAWQCSVMSAALTGRARGTEALKLRAGTEVQNDAPQLGPIWQIFPEVLEMYMPRNSFSRNMSDRNSIRCAQECLVYKEILYIL